MRFAVAKPFKLLLAANRSVAFAAGEQDIPDDLADHWYVRLNATPLPEPEPEPEPESDPAGADTDEPDGGEQQDDEPAPAAEPEP